MKKALWVAALAAVSIPFLGDLSAQSGQLRPGPAEKPRATAPAAARPPAVLVAKASRTGSRVAADLEHDTQPAEASASPETRPLALAGGDLDRDGVPDLIAGYASERGGVLVIHRGNIDSVYPNAPEAQQRKADGRFTDAPFLSETRLVEIPEAPDYLATGDFDNDGRIDVLAAARGGRALQLISSDVRGELTPARLYPISGLLTALTTGEWNRPDGLPDVVVGVIGEKGAGEVHAFSGEDGALRAQPESFAVGGPVAALALGRLDEDYTLDLAIAAGRELLLLAGRDPLGKSAAGNRVLGRYALETLPVSLAVGSYAGTAGGDLAVLGSDGMLRVLERLGQQAPVAAEIMPQEPAFVGRRSLKARAGSTLQFDGSLAALPEQADIAAQESMIGPFSWKETESAPETGKASRLVAAGASDLVLWNGSGPPRLLALGRDASKNLQGNLEKPAPKSGGAAVAVLPMRLNADAVHDLVVLREGSTIPGLIMSQAAAVFTVTSAGDGGDCDAGDSICATDPGSGCPNGPCTLRAAIQQSNASGGADVITFAIGSGPVTISPTTALPNLTGAVTIDGTSQPGFAGAPIVEIDGVSAGSANGLTVDGGTSTIRGLALNRFTLRGIEVRSAGNFIEGNYTGINIAGTLARSNLGDGILITNTANNVVGGLVAAARNVASGNAGNGIQILGASAVNNQIRGNYVGTNPAGTAALGNGIGSPCSGGAPGAGVVANASPNNTIGGTVPQARNLISGNLCDGLTISGPGAGGNLIQGNFVGTNAAGTGAVPNAVNAGGGGVRIVAPNATVGGTAAGAGNLVSGNNEDGVEIPRPDMAGNIVRGNLIGTDGTGLLDLGNAVAGVLIPLSPGATVGGTTAPARNVISGNTYGIVLLDGATNILVQGNYIGLEVDGDAGLGNDRDGIFILDAPNNTIGGTAGVSVPPDGDCTGACNAITGNGHNGILIFGADSSGNTIQGNYVGPTALGLRGGTQNRLDGVAIDGAPDNTIGGTTQAAQNFISFNARYSVSISGSGATGNKFQGNLIGVVIPGFNPGGPRSVSISGGASDNEIGGADPGAGNQIGVGALGVVVESGTGNKILGNSFTGDSTFCTDDYGIDLANDGPTMNDAGDADSGPNNLQNFPLLTSVSGGTVTGTLNSTPSTTFRLEFFNADCLSSKVARGKNFLGFADVTTDGSGSANFSVPVPGVGLNATATATDPAGNTSEFAPCVQKLCSLQLLDVSPPIIIREPSGEGRPAQPQGGT